MRKQFRCVFFVALATISLFVQSAMSQNSSPYWSLAGNSNASTSSKLGTTNAIPLRFLTKNSERLRIDTAGNVGIGTTTIGSRLTVNSASGASPLKVQINGATKLYMSSGGGLSVGSGTAAPSNGLYVSGNVGIGIAAPTKKLQVVGTSLFTSTLTVSDGGLSVKNTTGSLGNAALDANGSLYGITSQGGNYGVFASSTSGTGVFGSSTNAKGVQGSGGTYGVYGTTTTSGGTGVYGKGYKGVQGDGTYGVFGVGTNTGVSGTGPTGVYGESNNSGYGVWGRSSTTQSTTGNIGVYGTGYYGVKGEGINGVYGVGDVNSNGTGVYGTGTYGVQGISNAFAGVYGYGNSYGGEFYASPDNSLSIGVYGKGGAKGVQGEGPTGVYGVSTNSGYGVIGSSTATYNSNGSAGVYGSGYYGVLGQSGSVGIGVYGHGAFGVYGVGSSGGKGIYGTTDGGGWAGYFVGPVYSTSTFNSSDRKLKKNITDFTSAMDIISKLQPKTYEYRQDGNYKLMNLPEGKHYGLIAQDVETVLPNLVKESSFDVRMAKQAVAKPDSGKVPTASTTTQQPAEVIDFKAVNYTELIPIVIKAMQEQQQENNDLKARVAKLEDLVSKLTMGQRSGNTNTTLSQNTPNPASGSTRISCTVPMGSHAQLLITDAAGKTIKSIPVTASGAVDVNTASLSSGVYNYTLVVDGKAADTKKMLIVR